MPRSLNYYKVTNILLLGEAGNFLTPKIPQTFEVNFGHDRIQRIEWREGPSALYMAHLPSEPAGQIWSTHFNKLKFLLEHSNAHLFV